MGAGIASDVRYPSDTIRSPLTPSVSILDRANAGAYTLVVEACESGDPDC